MVGAQFVQPDNLAPAVQLNRRVTLSLALIRAAQVAQGGACVRVFVPVFGHVDFKAFFQ